MKKVLSVAAVMAVGFASVGFSGCDDYVTPSGVVNTVAHALHDNDLAMMTKATGGEARKQFASRDGMSELKGRIFGNGSLKVESAKQIKVTDKRDGFLVGVRTYSVDVTGVAPKASARSVVASATVDCDIFVTNQECLDRRGYYNWMCMGDELTECRVVEIK